MPNALSHKQHRTTPRPQGESKINEAVLRRYRIVGRDKRRFNCVPLKWLQRHRDKERRTSGISMLPSARW